jgi:sulfide:quinone oxidoreductase
LYGYNDASAVKKTRDAFIPSGVNFIQAEINSLDTKGKKVETSNGTFEYDKLVISLGCDVHPEDVPGMEDSIGSGVEMFYRLPSALQLQKTLSKIEKGRVVLNIAEMPIKCPVAPIEFVFLADYYFTKKGIRDKVEIVLSTPLPSAFSKPVASGILESAMKKKNIHVVGNFTIAEVDNSKKVIKCFEKTEQPYDLLVAIPPNLGEDFIDEAGIGNGAGYVNTDPHTLKANHAEDIYALGDITNVHTSKAGSVTHFMADVVVENLMLEIEGKNAKPEFDGHSNCFIESGFSKGYLIDFSYDVEPLPGNFPLPVIGPFGLLKDTIMNHIGKMAFRSMYWNKLLRGKPLAPFGLVSNKHIMRGKDPSYLKKN